jgi:2'-5' RNA ligase
VTETTRRTRAFVGVELDEPTRDLLAAHLVAHAGERLPGKAVPPANWHLTLRFLGLSSDVQIDRVKHHLEAIATGAEIRIRFVGLGAFPRPPRATVLWLGVGAGSRHLADLAAEVERAATTAGFASEERPFHPHLTLARIRPPRDVSALIDSFPPFDVTMPVSTIALFESRLGHGGAMYSVLERFLI